MCTQRLLWNLTQTNLYQSQYVTPRRFIRFDRPLEVGSLGLFTYQLISVEVSVNVMWLKIATKWNKTYLSYGEVIDNIGFNLGLHAGLSLVYSRARVETDKEGEQNNIIHWTHFN